MRKNNIFILIVALSCIISLIMVGCSREPQTLKVNLNALDIKWDITEINAKAGQPIEITLTNDGALDHNFVIEELGIEIEIAPGDTSVVALTAPDSGSLDYVCDIPGHQEAGMVGSIKTTP